MRHDANIHPFYMRTHADFGAISRIGGCEKWMLTSTPH
jgi:hypothetical protein